MELISFTIPPFLQGPIYWIEGTLQSSPNWFFTAISFPLLTKRLQCYLCATMLVLGGSHAMGYNACPKTNSMKPFLIPTRGAGVWV